MTPAKPKFTQIHIQRVKKNKNIAKPQLTFPSNEKGSGSLLIFNRYINANILEKAWLTRAFGWQWWKVVFSVT